jgi:excisionase family DNA binding protein
MSKKKNPPLDSPLPDNDDSHSELPLLLTFPHAARLLSMSVRHLEREIELGHIRQWGSGKMRRIPYTELEKYVARFLQTG